MPETVLPVHKKLTQIIFEWQAENRTSLLAFFMVLEVTMHWFWCLFVWWGQKDFSGYVQMGLLKPVWIGVTLMGLLFAWLVHHFSTLSDNKARLYRWQLLLITCYSFYIAIMVLVMGYSSLVSGVSLVGGAMLGMMLVRRRYMWWAFLWQVALIVVVTMIPYLGVKLPNLRQLTITSIPLDTYSYLTYSETTTIENAIAASIFKNGKISWENVEQVRRSSAFFWRSTHLYLALPKAIFMVYMFRKLLVILDDSKNEILEHANKDELTKLDNRRFGLSQIQATLMTLQAAQYYSMILLDLDWFKRINDSYGHDAGDQVLREVAGILTDSLLTENALNSATSTPIKGAIVSRYGGEEFLIGLPNVSHDQAFDIAEAIRVKIAKHTICMDNGLSFSITASFGLYSISNHDLSALKQHCQNNALPLPPNPEQSPSPSTSKTAKPIEVSLKKKRPYHKRKASPVNQLSSAVCRLVISTADNALYQAKGDGRNRVISANKLIADGKIQVNFGT